MEALGSGDIKSGAFSPAPLVLPSRAPGELIVSVRTPVHKIVQGWGGNSTVDLVRPVGQFRH
jgi:hypothetical protein